MEITTPMLTVGYQTRMKNPVVIILVSMFGYGVFAEKTGKVKGTCKLKNFTKDIDIMESLMIPLSGLVEERSCKCVDDAVKSVKKELEKMKWTKKTMKSCLDLYKAGKTKDGIFTIFPDGIAPTKVYCDMKNGGWTIVHRRINGKVSFDRYWKDYVKGFGDLNADHWIGLKNINKLTKHPNEISFELLMDNGKTATAVYGGFQIENEDAHFRMHVSGTGTYNREMMNYVDAEGPGFYYQDGMMFTTKDADHDLYKTNCAHLYNNGGWWYKGCYRMGKFTSNFNNMYTYAANINKSAKLTKIIVKLREIF